MIKKSNVITINLTNQSVAILQELKYLDKGKKSTGKGTSKFINRIIGSFYFTSNKDNGLSLRKKLLAQELNQCIIQAEERQEYLVKKIEGLKKLELARREVTK